MRIDSSQISQPLPGSQRAGANVVNNAIATATAERSNLVREDQAELSGIHAQTQALAAQVAKLPEVQQDKVHALRQAVIRGNYQPSLDKVAGALFNTLVVDRAA